MHHLAIVKVHCEDPQEIYEETDVGYDYFGVFSDFMYDSCDENNWWSVGNVILVKSGKVKQVLSEPGYSSRFVFYPDELKEIDSIRELEERLRKFSLFRYTEKLEEIEDKGPINLLKDFYACNVLRHFKKIASKPLKKPKYFDFVFKLARDTGYFWVPINNTKNLLKVGLHYYYRMFLLSNKPVHPDEIMNDCCLIYLIDMHT